MKPATISAKAADKPHTHEARDRDDDQRDSDKDESEAVVTGKRPRQPFQLQPTPGIGEFILAIVSRNRLNFSMTNPNAITAMPVRTLARNLRSLAA
jgi:hypothetical protein